MKLIKVKMLNKFVTESLIGSFSPHKFSVLRIKMGCDMAIKKDYIQHH